VNRSANRKKCQNCGGELVQREDDKPETVLKRLRIYAESTAPVKDFYETFGLLQNVSARGSIEEVKASILALIDHR
jgi:adenylate kinase